MDLDTVKMYMQLLKYLFQYRIVKNRSVILVIFLFSGIAAFTGYRAKKSLMSYRRRKLYMKKREVRRNECKNALQSLRHHLAEVKVEESESITQCSSSQLRQGIKQGKFKVIDVLRAFQQKALAVHDQTNCLVEPIHNAEDAAIEADGSDKHGLLAGIPVSFKNDVMIKGHVSCQGSAYLLENVAKDDCALVKVIKRHGGIPFMRTNLPLLCKSIESGNPIYGVTEHAHRKGFSPGGSSSGEGALVGGGGSILGIGSDIGGSIRIPAHFNGICGFKPTNGRMSKYDQFSLLHYSQTPIKITFGPLARDVDTLILACRALWDGSFRDFDPIFPPLKLNDEKLEDKRALRIGWFSRHEDFVTPVPACQRAVQMAKHHLENAGHTLISWTPPAKDVRMSYSFLWADRGEQLQTVVEDEDMPVSWRHIESTVKTPYWKRWLKHKLFCVTSPQKAKQMKCTLGARSILDYWTNEVDLQNYRYKVLSEMKEMGLDAILCPPLHVPALPLGTIKTAMNGFEYVFLFNVLDFPAGVVKMTRVTSGDIEDMASYPERTQDDIALKKMMQETEGLPVGVQVASATWEDEVCLRVMKELEGATDYQTDGRDHSK